MSIITETDKTAFLAQYSDHESGDELEEAETLQADEDGFVLQEKKKKKNLSEQYLEYLLQHSICNYQQQLSRPIEEWAKFAAHPRLTSLQSNYFDIVQNRLRALAFSQVFTPLDRNGLARAITKRGERIENLLLKHHALTEKQFKLFLRAIIGVVNMKYGKKNTFYLLGRSNTGKSQLLATFAYSYFRNGIGCQSNNVRSGFPWNDAIVKRLLLIEEPQMNDDNFEDYKKIMGGELLRCDKKYAPSGEVPPTPVFMTSNAPIWRVIPQQAEAYQNRCFNFFLGTPIPEENEFMPLEKLDWDIVLTKYWHKFKLKELALNYDMRNY